MADGVYISIFCVKDGVPHTIGTVSAKEFVAKIASSVVDGFEETVNAITSEVNHGKNV